MFRAFRFAPCVSLNVIPRRALYRQACDLCKQLGTTGEAKLQEVLVVYARLVHRMNKTRDALHLYEELVALATKLKNGSPCSELGAQKHSQP